MSYRFSLRFTVLSLAALALVACSSTSPDSSPDAADASSDAPQGPAGACVVVATDYDTSCTTDADCVGAPPGGNTCDPCHAGSGDFSCDLTAINVKDSARYAADLAAAFKSIQGTATYEQCVVNACPTNGAVACVGGRCALGTEVLTTEGGVAP